mmetsp:Transcript_152865/g.490366  ORF Transcript_152865/g.490366 Transcript_152865/m.490366 type:complete len:193 (-) Transcript_152865:47-625(-)|eukprot:CAMPEP_0203909444 /NCGR_PEP_ID=MMETSP0359-20131031/50747_1 /ASSEMBLY_ACC=CAM_ASM_000338 /TAXON_ID=268821 /ORGANISM="Scrippsiella Hangoei, Strain SHTV-5" /LENGTH=192 /DNA_ID=CAMNT_0050834681 /DNA_START=110 /DNA_END=688 /DNA_ORIENTATION=-
MGAVASGVTGAGCCTNRRAPVRCWNPQLSCRLVKIEYSGESFEEVWFFLDTAALDWMPTFPGSSSSASIGPPAEGKLGDQGTQAPPGIIAEVCEPHYTIVFNYGPGPLRPLRLDWRSDGLSFLEGGLRPREEVRFKVFDDPLRASELIGRLKELERRVYDPLSFNSKHFCEYLFDAVEGREEGKSRGTLSTT